MKDEKFTTEVVVGIFLVIGFCCIAAFAVRFGAGWVFGEKGWAVSASFSNIAGLKVGAPVEIAGVPVGKVTGIALDDKRQAKVSLQIRHGVRFDDDAVASIRTKGLIGEKYVKVSPGASGKAVKAGDDIFETEPAIEIEEIVGKFIYNK